MRTALATFNVMAAAMWVLVAIMTAVGTVHPPLCTEVVAFLGCAIGCAHGAVEA